MRAAYSRRYASLPRRRTGRLRQSKINATTFAWRPRRGLGTMEPRAKPARPKSRAITARAQRPRPAGPRLSVGFILARRFTLCAFANFVDVLRLAADEGDRSRPIFCDWSVLSDSMDPVPSSCGVTVQPNERLGDPSEVRLHRRSRRASRGDPEHQPRLYPLSPARGGVRRAARRPLHRCLYPAPCRADARLSRLRQLVLPRRLPRAVRRPRADLRPDLRRRWGPAHLRRRGELGPPCGLSRREARRPGAGEQEPAYHDHRQRDAAGEATARYSARAED